MNYYIERHDMEIILDALEALHNNIKNGLKYPYTLDEVDLLFQSLDNSGEEARDLK
jgi:hypothetical protein